MLFVFLVPLMVALCISAFGIGLYAGVKRSWPVPELKGLVAKLTNQATGKDQFGRLLSYPGKIEIACPSQDQMTAVLLLIGQSNAANYQGQRHQSEDDRVINSRRVTATEPLRPCWGPTASWGRRGPCSAQSSFSRGSIAPSF